MSQVHLAELLTLGARPGAGLLLALTGRCPLSCSHCSTASTMNSPQYPGTPFRRLVDSFAAVAPPEAGASEAGEEPEAIGEPGERRPEALLLSGGEPLLRPALVRDLARRARSAGTRTALLSGMFFARGGGRIPPAVRSAVAELDHLAVSVDAPHEREVPRRHVLTALTALLDLVPAASLHVTASPGCGTGPDPYTDGLVAEVRERFGERVPLLVSAVQPTGRAAASFPRPAARRASEPGPDLAGPRPCPFVAWPLVDVDGTVYACTRQSLLRADAPAHLVLGHAARDGWPALRARTLGRPLLRAVRTLGPLATRERFAGEAGGGHQADTSDPCAACLGLAGGGTGERVAAFLETPGGVRTETAVGLLLAGRPPRALATARGAVPRYAHLTELGWSGVPCRTG